MNEESIRLEIIEVAKQLHQKNMLAAADGNISCRIDDEHILITPAAKAKAFITPDDIAVITIDNKIVSGNPSSERLMHLAVYKACEKASCVVHAHPPTAIAWSVACPELKALPSKSLSELVLTAESIPIVPYARPGTITMGDNLLPFLPQAKLMILAHHGALTWGSTLKEAWFHMERLEHSAEILMRAKMMGAITALPEAELEELHKLRKIILENAQ